jgi:hypothetical protein
MTATTPATVTLDVKNVKADHKETMTNRGALGGYATKDASRWSA